MANVWWVGNGNSYEITASQWSSKGILSASTKWDADNGWSIAEAAFTSDQLTILAEQSDFTFGNEGPRLRPGPFNRDTSKESSYIYYAAIKAIYDLLVDENGDPTTYFEDQAVDAINSQLPSLVVDILDDAGIVHGEELDDDEFGVRFDDGDYFVRANETDGITSKITHLPKSVPAEAALFLRSLPVESGWKWALIGSNDRAFFGERDDGSFYPDLGAEAPVISPVLQVGDSLTENWGSSSLATALARDVVNIGVGGQTPDQIAARHGGRPALLTLTSNAIPASGAVTITAYDVNLLIRTGNGTSTLLGSLMGVPGTLSMTQTTGPAYAYTFTRTTPGDPVACPPATPFQSGAAYLDHQLIVCVGRNGFKTVAPADIVASIESMLAYNRRGRTKALVLSVPPSELDTAPDLVSLAALNDALKVAFGAQFVDTAGFLRSVDTLDLVGITPTTDDTDNIAAGLTPDSFTTDGLHYNSDAYEAINILISQHYAAKGL